MFRILLFFAILYHTVFSVNSIINDKHYITVNSLSFSGGSNYNAQIDILSGIYQYSFPGIGLKINSVEMNIINKNEMIYSLFTPYILIPLRNNKNSLNSKISDGEVEFFLGANFFPIINNNDANNYMFNGGLSINKLFDLFKSVSTSLSIGYKTYYNNDSKSLFNDYFYGMITLHSNLFKTSKHGETIENQIKNISFRYGYQLAIYPQYLYVHNTLTKAPNSFFFNTTITHNINDRWNLLMNFSDIGTIETIDISINNKSISIGPELYIIKNGNGLNLPIDFTAGALIMDNGSINNYEIDFNVSPIFMLSLNPSYNIQLGNITFSPSIKSTLFASYKMSEYGYEKQAYHKLFGYSLGSEIGIHF